MHRDIGTYFFKEIDSDLTPLNKWVVSPFEGGKGMTIMFI
jgi:hypothetical protein